MRAYLATKFRSGMVGPRDKDILDNLENGTAALDTISEKTAGAGVTADGVLLKDGGATLSGKLTTSKAALTIASDAVTVTASYHTLAGEGAAEDDLVTINGGSDGQRLILRAVSDSVTITVKSTGNIVTSGSDFAMDNQYDTIELVYDSTLAKWLELCRSNNGA